MKKIQFLFVTMIVFIFLLSFLTCCVESRFKIIETDPDGSGSASVSITQDAKILFTGYSCSKLNCGTQIMVQISIASKDIVRDNFVYIDKGQATDNLKAVNIRSGDEVRIKVSQGCPNTKYTLNFSLDTGD